MEEIYTIPVNEAFEGDCECPICAMYHKLEKDAIDFTMGPSYMEDDIRAATDEMGFCQKHMQMLSKSSNKLGNALILKTHFDKVINDVSNLSQGKVSSKRGIFAKKQEGEDAVAGYINKLNKSCYVCDRIDTTFMRYVDTCFHLWKKDSSFKEKIKSSKGFCTQHYGLLRNEAGKKLSGAALDEFIAVIDGLYLENMKRVRDDLEWFINKFDYKYANEPWKNAKDSLVRAVIKSNCIIEDDK